MFVQAVLLVTLSVPTTLATISFDVPDGWRQLEPLEPQALKPKLKPENKLLQKLNDGPSPNSPLIAIKHDFAGDSIAASVQLFESKLSGQLRGASSIEAARVIAFYALAAFHGNYEIEPRETRVAGFAAAEWVIRYQLIESAGKNHDMRTRNIVIARDGRLYLLGYSGPAIDTADFEAFGSVVASVKFGQ